MSKHEIDSTRRLHALIEMIKDDADSEITFFFKKDSKVYKNSSNLIILKKLAEDHEKSLKFEAENPAHKDYIDAVNGDHVEFNDDSVDLDSSKSGSKNPLKIFSVFSSRSKFPNELSATDNKIPVNRKRLIKVVIVPILVLSLMLGGLFALWWYIPSAFVKVSVDSEVLVKLLNVKAKTTATGVSVDEATLPAIKLEVTDSNTQSVATTGKKEVGDKAEGTVKLFNKTDKEIKVDKGTILSWVTSKDESLKFETTEEVKVSAQTEKADGSGTEYGTKDVDVKAIEFGDKYNLDGGQKFEIKDYDTDELVGENDNKIKGGSLEEINVVAQADLDSLKRDLEDSTQLKVLSSLQKKTVSGQVLQESSAEYTVLSADYNAKLDDEADNVSLTITMKGTGLAYDKDNLDSLVGELIKTVVPERYDLNGDDPEYEVAATKAGDDELDLQIKLRSFITPKLDEDQMRNNLTGMRLNEAQKYLDGLTNIKGYELEVTPKLPPVLQTLPHVAGNIQIQVEK